MAADIGFCTTHHVMSVAMALRLDRKLRGVDIDTPNRGLGLQRSVVVVVHALSRVVQPGSFDLETGPPLRRGLSPPSLFGGSVV